MSEDEAIEILKDFKKRINTWHAELVEEDIQATETILDLYKKAKYELKGKECLVDTMTHNEEVLTRNYEILEKKLQQEREKNNKIEKYIRSNEWVEDYEKSSCRTKILRILEE